ncbi:MAG TPA: L-rhamnose isomerase [Chloroflexia bacterium]|nr:L-rhamnose isomerase [Chloroflexia bacterium]
MSKVYSAGTNRPAYEQLAETLATQGFDVEAIKKALKNQKIETASWAFANSGTRFKAFPHPGAATTTRQKLDDAAVVNRLTGVAPSVALHIPWDRPEDGDYVAMYQYAQERGIRLGAINSNVFQDNAYRLGSVGNPDQTTRQMAVDHMLECCDIMTKVNSDQLKLWFADGTNYPGQDSLRGRKQRMEDALQTVYKHLPENSRMLVEYKFYEPAFYSTDIPDWGTAYAMCMKLGEKAQVVVDLGHHAQATNIEQIVAFLLDEGKLGGFDFNDRKYGDDDLIVGSNNPYQLFLIYNELVGAEQSGEPVPSQTAQKIAYMLDQCHNIEGKIGAIIYSVMNCQEIYAKALLVERRKLAEAQAAGEVLAAHRILTDAFRTDVRPLLEQVREEMGLEPDPLAAYRASGYEEKIRQERGMAATSGGFQ